MQPASQRGWQKTLKIPAKNVVRQTGLAVPLVSVMPEIIMTATLPAEK
jgi:hypothetical protein